MSKYRYDTETGMYYLNSRYYNPDWGRFINADALGGNVGELLSHNIFAYCKNNPVNMQDPNGYRYSIIDGGVQDDIYMGRANKIEPAHSTPSSYNPIESGVRNTAASAGGVGVGDKIVRSIKNGASYLNATEIHYGYGMSRIIKDLSMLTKFKGLMASNIGSIINSGFDFIKDISKGKYFGALMDVAGLGAGCGVGVLIELGAGLLVGTVGLPGLVVGGAAFGVSVLAGMGIDYITSKAKDEYYGGA